MTLTETQNKALSLLPILPAMASCICSGVLIRLMYRASFRTSYRRIVFILSAFDILNTIRICLGVFLVPYSTSRRPYAFGNATTCKILGFATNFTVPAYTYYAALSFYFLFRIKYRMTDSYFAKKIEPWLHICFFGFSITCSVLPLFLGLYDEVQFGNSCWIAANPAIGCGKSCVVALQWIFAAIPFTMTFVILLVNNFAIIFHVRQTVEKSSSRSMTNASVKMQKNVAAQAFLYVLVYFLAYLWTLIIRVMAMVGRGANDEGDLFFLFLIKSILHPSLGVGNLLVYVRPRYIHYKHCHPDVSSITAFIRVVFNDDIDAMFQPNKRQRRNRYELQQEADGRKSDSFTFLEHASAVFSAVVHRLSHHIYGHHMRRNAESVQSKSNDTSKAVGGNESNESNQTMDACALYNSSIDVPLQMDEDTYDSDNDGTKNTTSDDHDSTSVRQSFHGDITSRVSYHDDHDPDLEGLVLNQTISAFSRIPEEINSTNSRHSDDIELSDKGRQSDGFHPKRDPPGHTLSFISV